MKETPNAEYFIASLHNAGWEGTLDAQHEKIEALWKRITDEHKRELAAMTDRAKLAERQVAVLMPFVKLSGCCPEGKQATCSLSAKCEDCWSAWSRAEAVKEGGKG